MPHIEILSDRAVLSVAGPAARDFLQGLVTNDMAGAKAGAGIYAALLTPQGKILHEFFVAAAVDGFLVDCAATSLADLTKRLTLYRLRAKVEIAALPGHAVAASWEDTAPAPVDGMIVFADPRLPALGARILAPKAVLETALGSFVPGDYRGHALGLGVPASADLPPDSIFALDAGLDELHGVNFRKGCYVGQEVTSRMKHRATARRRPLIAEFASPPPQPGTRLEASGHEIGVLATGAGQRALAHVRLDRLADAEAAHMPVTAAGLAVRLRKPDWIAV